MKDKSKKSTYSTTFGVDPHFFVFSTFAEKGNHVKYEGYDKYRSLCYFKATAFGYCPFGMVENCH